MWDVTAQSLIRAHGFVYVCVCVSVGCVCGVCVCVCVWQEGSKRASFQDLEE